MKPAEAPEASQALVLLLAAYPEKTITPESLRLYLDELSGIPAWLLLRAVHEHIQSSAWFPRIAELRQAAAQLAGVPPGELKLLPERPAADPLTARFKELEDAFYHEDGLDEPAWLALIEQLKAADRPHRAEAAKLRLAWMRAEVEGNEQAAVE